MGQVPWEEERAGVQGLLAVEPIDDHGSATQACGPQEHQPTLPAGQIITTAAPLEASHADADTAQKRGDEAEPPGGSLGQHLDRSTRGAVADGTEGTLPDDLQGQVGRAESSPEEASDTAPLVRHWEAQSLGDQWEGGGGSLDGAADELAAEAAALPALRTRRSSPQAPASEFVVVDLGSPPGGSLPQPSHACSPTTGSGSGMRCRTAAATRFPSPPGSANFRLCPSASRRLPCSFAFIFTVS